MIWLRRRSRSVIALVNAYTDVYGRKPRIVPIYSTTTGDIIGWMRAA